MKLFFHDTFPNDIFYLKNRKFKVYFNDRFSDEYRWKVQFLGGSLSGFFLISILYGWASLRSWKLRSCLPLLRRWNPNLFNFWRDNRVFFNLISFSPTTQLIEKEKLKKETSSWTWIFYNSSTQGFLLWPAT